MDEIFRYLPKTQDAAQHETTREKAKQRKSDRKQSLHDSRLLLIVFQQ